MKKIVLVLALLTTGFYAKSQTCQEYKEFVKSEDYGSTYPSYTSDAISEVTFYDVQIDFQTYYFAIVCFNNNYPYGCSEYIYLVDYDTEVYYAMDYQKSAGKAFWKYIQPYNENLGCAPNYEFK